MSGQEVVLLRFDAPLMSFGGPAVDNVGVTQDHPTLSMVAGLLANALGYRHQDADALQRLQARLRIASRRDRAGAHLIDFQTVDLGQRHMREGAWTTRGYIDGRGGASAEDTHIRYRHYLADAVFTVAVKLEPPHERPTIADIASALTEPARPLFLGRKACLPATPLLLGVVAAPSLREALRSYPPLPPARADAGAEAAWWPSEEGGEGTDLVVVDERDWANQIHVGRRVVRHGRLRVTGRPSTGSGGSHDA